MLVATRGVLVTKTDPNRSVVFPTRRCVRVTTARKFPSAPHANKAPSRRCRLPLLVFAPRDSAAAAKGGATRTRVCTLAGGATPESVAPGAPSEPEQR